MVTNPTQRQIDAYLKAHPKQTLGDIWNFASNRLSGNTEQGGGGRAVGNSLIMALNQI